MPTVETLGTPYQCVIETLTTILGLVEGAILLELLRVAVVDSDGEETDSTLGQHVHAIEAKHDLVAGVLGEVVIALHAKLVLFEVVGDAFGERKQRLAVLAVGAVEGEGLVHGLLLTLDLDGHALLVEFVLRNAQIHPRQQELVVPDETTVKGQFAVLQSDLPLLQEQTQVYTHHRRLLQLSRLVHVVLQNHLGLPSSPEQYYVVQFPEGGVVVNKPRLELLKVLTAAEATGVEEAVSDGQFANSESGIGLFHVVVLAIAEETGTGTEAGVGKTTTQGCKVVGIKIEPFTNFSDLLVELADLLATGALRTLFVANRELFPFHEDLFELLVLDNPLVDLRKRLQSELHGRHFRIAVGSSDHTQLMQGLGELEHPYPLQHLQIQRISLLVQGNLHAVLDPVEETVAALRVVLELLEQQPCRPVRHQLAVELLPQNVTKVRVGVYFRDCGEGLTEYA